MQFLSEPSSKETGRFRSLSWRRVLYLSHNRNVHEPRALAIILAQAEDRLAAFAHPDPYISQLPSLIHFTC